MPSPVSEFTSPAFTEAFTAVRSDIDGMLAAELQPITLDVRGAVFDALGVSPKVLAHRPAILAKFGDAQAAHVDRLETVARAAGWAHAEHQSELTGKSLEPLSDLVVELRGVLLVDAQSLVHRQLIDAGLLGELKGIQGPKNQCFDLLQLVSVFRKNWTTIEAATPVKAADLDRAEALANQLATAAGIRDQAIAGVSPSAVLRQRAYTLLVRTYGEVRRMITYLRWEEGDADAIAPSLWAGRTARREAEPAPAMPAPNGGTPIAPGMPGASPFVSS